MILSPNCLESTSGAAASGHGGVSLNRSSSYSPSHTLSKIMTKGKLRRVDVVSCVLKLPLSYRNTNVLPDWLADRYGARFAARSALVTVFCEAVSS